VRVDHFHSSRTWIGNTGSKHRRTTTLTFKLRKRQRVVFTVTQVSPACTGIGHFSVVGRAGLNRVRFTGVVHGRRLKPGTYRIAIRATSGRVVRRVTLVVVGASSPSPAELQAMRSANACSEAAIAQTAFAASPFVGNGGQSGFARAMPKLPKPPRPSAAGLVPTKGPNLHSGVLGSSVEETARAIQPFLVALLGLSILLLGAASLPREAVPGPRVHDVLARHRLELAALGAAALLAVALVFFLT
jgi:hypothetical protein